MQNEPLLFWNGVVLIVFGACITTVFWVPKLVDRNRLQQLLGSRYPLVYIIYLANGPVLLLLGIILAVRFS